MAYRGGYKWTAVWIIFSVWCQCVPWILSAAGQLNRVGYGIAIAVSLPFAVYGLRKWFSGSGPCLRLVTIRGRWWSRCRRQPVFGVWLLIVAMALIGGLIYEPTNHDGLTYRFPRLLHWFWEGRWHWIAQPADVQMNLSTHGFEWLMGFFFGISGSDRLFFLPNLISYLLMPGLLFAFLTQLGVHARVASWWMWIFPCGYGFALQAGSIGNDLFAIPYALGGVVFALRARKSKQVRDLLLAICAAALVTGTKLSNAPLVLPIGLAMLTNLSWALRWRNLPPVLGTAAIGVLASAAPVMIACTLYTGHFSGDPENLTRLNVQNPIAGLVANSLQTVSRNLMPPVNPAAGWWNGHYRGWLPDSVNDFLAVGFPRFQLPMSELPQEEGDGLGLGVTTLLLVVLGAIVVRRFRRSGSPAPRVPSGPGSHRDTGTGTGTGVRWVCAGVVAATLVYFLKMGSEAGPRLLLPYYPLLLAPVLRFRENNRVVRRGWWKVLTAIVALFVLPAVILSPRRTMLPVRSAIAMLPESVQQKRFVGRLTTVYDTYAVRNDAMAPLRKWLPGSGPIGFIGHGRSLRVGLWRPFGSRKVESLTFNPDGNQSVYRLFTAIVLDLAELEADAISLDEWAIANGLQVVATETVKNYASASPEHYAVLVPGGRNEAKNPP